MTAFVDDPGLGEEWWKSHRGDTFVSASHCINHEWAPDVDWYSPVHSHHELPGDSSRVQLGEWLRLCGDDYGFPSTFRTLSLTQRFISEFLQPSPRPILIAFAIHCDDWPRLKRVADGEQMGSPGSYSENSEISTARLGIAPDAGGELLGYDIIQFDHGPQCCWYCGGHDDDLRDLFDIHANKYGLVGMYAGASKAARYIDDPNTSSEPGLWLPVAVFRYAEKAAEFPRQDRATVR